MKKWLAGLLAIGLLTGCGPQEEAKEIETKQVKQEQTIKDKISALQKEYKAMTFETYPMNSDEATSVVIKRNAMYRGTPDNALATAKEHDEAVKKAVETGIEQVRYHIIMQDADSYNEVDGTYLYKTYQMIYQDGELLPNEGWLEDKRK